MNRQNAKKNRRINIKNKMDDVMLMSRLEASFDVIGSEALLSLYPQVIRMANISVEIQTFIRVILIASCAYVFMKKDEGVRPNYYQGVVNTLHILSSYYAFKTINTGDALALFYTYPLWNLLFSHILLKEKMNLQEILYVIVGVIGGVLIAQPNLNNVGGISGIIAALLAAVTESVMYITYHNPGPKTSVSQRIFQLYGGSVPFISGIVLIQYLRSLQQKKTNEFFKNVNSRNILLIVGFNLFVGYTMHQMRAFGALKLSAPLFSSISMAGILFGYTFSYVFEKKIPNNQVKIGVFLILVACILSILKGRSNKTEETQQQKEDENKTELQN